MRTKKGVVIHSCRSTFRYQLHTHRGRFSTHHEGQGLGEEMGLVACAHDWRWCQREGVHPHLAGKHMSKGCWMLKLDTKSALSHHLDLQAAHPNEDPDERHSQVSRAEGKGNRTGGQDGRWLLREAECRAYLQFIVSASS